MVVIELSIECSNLVRLILFRTRAELEFIFELDNMFKLGLFIFLINSNLFTSCLINFE